MSILDRYIFVRFATNFCILFGLLFLLAVGVELVLALDEFVDAARTVAGPDAGAAAVVGKVLTLAIDMQTPRVFQLYAYLHGLVAVGAVGFTLAQMTYHRELTAVMASGVSLYRVAAPFFVGVFVLSMVQLLNQELILPRIAPLLIRGYSHMGQRGADEFAVKFTPDGKGNLLQATSFDPQTRTLAWPTILERDERGRTVRRITARRATWSEEGKTWMLTKGQVIMPRSAEESGEQVMSAQSIDSYQTDLTPQALLVRRYNQFAAMLSLSQISQMLESDLAQRDAAQRNKLLRYRYARLSSPLVTLLVLALSLPFLLLREPGNFLRQTVICSALTIPASIGAAVGMMVELPGIPPAVGVFLPVIVLMLMALFPWTFFKT
ncbi:MAG: LptF/LptG family permease [Phycisphaerales bacterium]|nr:LptF/LptG family permease [Phycisphaerales bacterium]MCI0631391.1 LptF/LptG family permease [Phycisphaerales bacterium]MCI0676629.1 LptF/LptG family permease [Phycisphaerales bacterium]